MADSVPFREAWDSSARRALTASLDGGGWTEDRLFVNDMDFICDILRAAGAAFVIGNPPSGILDQIKQTEVILAQAIVRLMELSAARGYRVGEAVDQLLVLRELGQIIPDGIERV